MIVRFHNDKITPIQVWNTSVGGKPFHELVGARRVDALKADGVPEHEIVRTLALDLRKAVHVLQWEHAFAVAYVAGGLTELKDFSAAVAPTMDVSPYKRFFAWAAARTLFDDPVVLDVGQTSIKGKPGQVYPRNMTALPYGDILGKADRAIDWIARTLQAMLASAPSYAPIVLTLPAPLDADCVPGENTYGFAGRRHTVDDILRAANAHHRKVYVANDAELAALLALQRSTWPTLVLTLGLGPGGALVDP